MDQPLWAHRTLDHEAAKGDKVKARDGLRQAFVVLCESPEPRRPGQEALPHSAPRQQHEAAHVQHGECASPFKDKMDIVLQLSVFQALRRV